MSDPDTCRIISLGKPLDVPTVVEHRAAGGGARARGAALGGKFGEEENGGYSS